MRATGLRAGARAAVLALALLGAVAPGSPCEAAAPAPDARPASPPPLAIPIEEVARRAAEVPDLLRILTAPLRPSAQIETIGARASQVRGDIDRDLAAAGSILQGRPTLDTLQFHLQLWQRRQLQTTGWLNVLTERATVLQDALRRMAVLERTWVETAEAARAAGAPAPILLQINAALAEIRAARAPLEAQRTAVLDLQAVVAHEVSRSGTALAQFAEAQERALGSVLLRDGPPVWSAEAWSTARAVLPGRIREVIAAHWIDLRRYIEHPASGMLWHVGILALVSLGLTAVRHRARELSASESPPAASDVLERPFSAMAVLTLVVVAAPGSSLPPTVRVLFVVLALGPAIGLTRLATDRRFAPSIYALWGLFAVDNLRDTVAGTPVIEQVILIAEMLMAMAALALAMHRARLWPASRPRGKTGLRQFARRGGVALVVALAVALLASAFGYMRLARLLASSLLGSGVLALTLYATVRVLQGLVSFALRLPSLRRLGLVQHHRGLLERRLRRGLIAVAVAGWVFRAVDYVGLFQPVRGFAGAVLTTQLGRGSIQVSLGSILEFIFTVWIAYLASAFIRFVLREDVYPRTRLTRGMAYAISSLLNYAIIALGFVLALGALGLDLTKVTVLAGALGVGIGFGLQSVVNNFVSGLILLFERPIHVGDIVEVGDLSGEVARIGIRASVVRTPTGAEIIVPNAQLVTERVTNWTLSDRARRIDIPVGVDYRSPPGRVVEVLEAVARAHPEVMQTPAPQAIFTGFGDSAIAFELRVWTSRFEQWTRVRTELAAALYAAVHEAGMTLPFPQRQVHIVREPAPSADASAAGPLSSEDGHAAPDGRAALPASPGRPARREGAAPERP